MSRVFGKALHTAFVVTDIDAEIRRLLQVGIGPVFVMRRIRPAALYRGERHDPLISAAFTYTGDFFLEFLQQHDATPSATLEFLEHSPAGGLHHFAYFSDDFGATLSKASEDGHAFDLVQEYVSDDGVPYEIYIQPAGEPRSLLVQLVHRGPLEVMYDRMREAAYSWNGEHPVREAADLLPEDMRAPKSS